MMPSANWAKAIIHLEMCSISNSFGSCQNKSNSGTSKKKNSLILSTNPLGNSISSLKEQTRNNLTIPINIENGRASNLTKKMPSSQPIRALLLSWTSKSKRKRSIDWSSSIPSTMPYFHTARITQFLLNSTSNILSLWSKSPRNLSH
jgi:hypothetical protein